MAYQYRDGTPYNGPTITTPDGRIMTGSTYTRESVRVIEVEDNGGKRSGKLHKADDAKAPVRKNKGRR